MSDGLTAREEIVSRLGHCSIELLLAARQEGNQDIVAAAEVVAYAVGVLLAEHLLASGRNQSDSDLDH